MAIQTEMPVRPTGGPAVSRQLPPDTYITMSGISWETFEGIAERTRGGRVRYDNGELEIMSPSFFHEDSGGCLRTLVEVLGEAFGVDPIAAGSTTWKNAAALKGVEADSAFWIDPAKLPIVEGLRAEGQKHITHYPSPDLAVEIDIRQPDAERTSVYAAVGAVEVWEYDGETIRIRRLGPGGSYVDVDRSGWFPITADQILAAIEGAPAGTTTRRRWLRAFVAGIVPQR